MKNLSDYTIPEKATLLQAVEKITANKSRAVIVLSDEKVVGVISEGDIMRAMLRGTDIHSPIQSFIIYSFKCLTRRDMAAAKAIFAEHLITLLPIINADFQLVDVIRLREVLRHED